MLKRMLVTLAVVGLTAYTYGQGSVTFDTSIAGEVARIRDVNGTFVGAGTVDGSRNTNFLAQLYAGANSSSLVAVGNPVNFRRGTAGSGYVQFSGTTTLLWPVITEVVIPNTIIGQAGGAVWVQLRAWWAGAAGTTYQTYEAAFGALGSDVEMRTGFSAPLFLASTGSAGPPAVPPATLAGLEGFSLTGGGAVIPEPSTLAFAGIGAAALLLFRRRK